MVFSDSLFRRRYGTLFCTDDVHCCSTEKLSWPMSTIRCPNCQRMLQRPPLTQDSVSVRCPSCTTAFEIPAANANPPPAPALAARHVPFVEPDEPDEPDEPPTRRRSGRRRPSSVPPPLTQQPPQPLPHHRRRISG